MPRPLRKLHTVVARFDDAEHAELVRLANGQPLGPFVAARAARPPDALVLLEERIAGMRGNPMHQTAIKLLAQLQAALR